MKKSWIGVLILSCFIYSAVGAACAGAQQKSGDVEIASGLESTQVSPGVRVVMPVGGKTRRINNSLSVIESADEYAARNFVDVNKRLEQFEKENEELKKQIKDIKEKLDELLKRFVIYE